MKFLTNIDLNKNELQNVVLQNLATAPLSPKEGQMYYNTTDKQAYQYKGAEIGWKKIGNGDITGIKRNGVVVDPVDGVVDIKVPTKVGELENDSKFITSAEAPVQSVNGDTGAVSVTTSSIGAVPTSRKINTKPLTGDITLNANDVGALPTTGGTMSGAIDMSKNKITNLIDGTSDTDAVTKKQMETAIAGIGTVFNLKGSKPNYEALPKDGNKIGDVWFVEDESVGYIWIEKNGVPQWEQFGPSIDLSGYLAKDGLLQTTGTETKNAMSQDATTKALKLKADASDVSKIPVVKVATGTILTSANSIVVAYTGTFLQAFANMNGEEVLTNVKVEADKVTFSTGEKPKNNVVCNVIYM